MQEIHSNTNALIACANAPGIPLRQFTAMTRLDQNRAVGQMAERANSSFKSRRRIHLELREYNVSRPTFWNC